MKIVQLKQKMPKEFDEIVNEANVLDSFKASRTRSGHFPQLSMKTVENKSEVTSLQNVTDV